jgi:hypothetical protein
MPDFSLNSLERSATDQVIDPAAAIYSSTRCGAGFPINIIAVQLQFGMEYSFSLLSRGDPAPVPAQRSKWARHSR